MRKLKKVIYASSAMREEEFTELFQNSKRIPGQQAQKFNRLMIKGFGKNGVDVLAISAPPINRSNCAARVKILGKKRVGNICYRYLPIWNVKKIRNLIVMLSSFWCAFWGAFAKEAVVVCDVLNISVSMGAVSAGRLLGKRCVGIVTDVPELMVTGSTPKMLKYCYKIIDKCTDYVFLTEPMNERLNPKNKPYTVVEGVCDEDLQCELSEQETGDSCLYAGLLDAEYGVKSMVEAFIEANLPDCTLHLCGNGPYVEELKTVTEGNKNIVYHGVMLNRDVMALEREVSLLINPRPSTGEFTKYSFPSKNMEYMTSGTPVLAMRLPGIPNEYYDHIYSFKGESVSEMAESLRDVFEQSKEARRKKGLEAYRFVTEHKSSKAQAKRVLELMEQK